jgi:phospholipase C
MAASPIEHVVIIVKENHAFDTYFGRYAKADGDGSLGQCANPPNQDPNHSHATWLQRHTKAVRLQYTQHDIPRYYSYARKFTLCDRYFSEVAGPSTPNHLMLIAAASPIIINPPHYRVTDVQPVFDLPSLAANLEQAGLTWANYGGYAFDMIKALKGRSKSSTEFVVDASAGKLPSVAWVYAPHATSEHPPSTPADRAAGVGTSPSVAAVRLGGPGPARHDARCSREAGILWWIGSTPGPLVGGRAGHVRGCRRPGRRQCWHAGAPRGTSRTWSDGSSGHLR